MRQCVPCMALVAPVGPVALVAHVAHVALVAPAVPACPIGHLACVLVDFVVPSRLGQPQTTLAGMSESPLRRRARGSSAFPGELTAWQCARRRIVAVPADQRERGEGESIMWAAVGCHSGLWPFLRSGMCHHLARRCTPAVSGRAV